MEKQRKIAVFIFFFLLIGIFILNAVEKNSEWIERSYARGFYRFYGYVPKVLFGYIPFSVGDLFYCVIVLLLLYLVTRSLRNLWKKRWTAAFRLILCTLNVLLGLYLFFYLSWGLNYYRKPISANAELQVDSLRLADYLMVLNAYVDSTNTLRREIDPAQWVDKKERIQMELVDYVKRDTTFTSFLSRSQVNAKSPLSSWLVSYFGVSGYFNPFTHDAQINIAMPATSVPFTCVHELAHQQGIGFEDEANFMAFVRLRQHPEAFYRYSAYLQTTLYMLRELGGMYPGLWKDYKHSLSLRVQKDIEEERLFWRQYTGWVDSVTGMFYNQYLKHNNQDEGIARYDRMTRLVLAYELKRRGCN